MLNEDENEDSVTFDLINTYKFRPDLTKGLTGNEIVTVPHMMLMVNNFVDSPGFRSTSSLSRAWPGLILRIFFLEKKWTPS